MSNRKCAYVATIDKIEKIPEKDRIVYASLKNLGWQVICSSDLVEGKKIIYIEYDTIIKEGPQWAEFLRKRCYSTKFRGFKISAMRMAGLVSYGLILTFQEAGLDSSVANLDDGFDLSETLGVSSIDDAEEFEKNQKVTELTKFQKFVKKYAYFLWKMFYYRKPESSGFPSQVGNKSDSTRIETLTRLFETAQGKKVYITTKMDGQSSLYGIYKNRFIISSRNVKQYDQPLKKAISELVPKNRGKFHNTFIEAACIYSIPQRMNLFKIPEGNSYSIQGELCAPFIQKGHTGVEDLTLFLFNLYDNVKKQYLNFAWLSDFSKESYIPTVPFVDYTTFTWKTKQELKELAKGSYENGHVREGIVIRQYNPDSPYLLPPEKEMSNMWDFKVINDEYIDS